MYDPRPLWHPCIHKDTCVLVSTWMSQRVACNGWCTPCMLLYRWFRDWLQDWVFKVFKCVWTHKTTAVKTKMKLPVSIQCLKIYCTVYMLHHRYCVSGLCAWRIDQACRKYQFDSWCKSYFCNKLGHKAEITKNKSTIASLQSTSSLLFNVQPSQNLNSIHTHKPVVQMTCLVCPASSAMWEETMVASWPAAFSAPPAFMLT